jgi:hypothetical protein
LAGKWLDAELTCGSHNKALKSMAGILHLIPFVPVVAIKLGQPLRKPRLRKFHDAREPHLRIFGEFV